MFPTTMLMSAMPFCSIVCSELSSISETIAVLELSFWICDTAELSSVMHVVLW